MQRRTYIARTAYWSVVVLCVGAAACGDEVRIVIPGAGDGAAGGPPTAGMGAAGAPPECVRLALSADVDVRTAAATCVGIVFAAAGDSDLRCVPLPVPASNGLGLVACELPQANETYLVEWTGVTSARVIANQRVVAALQKANASASPAAYDVEYSSGDRGRCTVTTNQLELCVEAL